MTGDAPLAASVVVPTRDRPAALARCLAALEHQTLAPLDIVVVNDGSRDEASIERVVAGSPSSRTIRGRGAGPAAARNAGAAAARGAVVCFTDDDCEPAPDWVERLLAALGYRRGASAEHGAEAAAGRTVNADRGDLLAAASQAIVTAVTESSLEPATGQLGFGPSCNVAATAGLLTREPFDESFPLAAGEDREWCARLRARGHPLVFAPRAVVAHRPALSARQFVRQHHRYGRGARRFHRTAALQQYCGENSPAALGGQAPGLQRAIVRAGAREGPVVGALVCLAQAITAAGYVREWLASVR